MMKSHTGKDYAHFSILRDLGGSLRQFIFPKEFRIAKPLWPVDFKESLAGLIQQIEDESTRNISAEESGASSNLDKVELLADVATGLWRARKNLVVKGSDTPREGMSKVFRHVQSIYDALEVAGMQIRDHTREKWADGRSINVVAFQPMPELSQETIIETIKPSVFYNDKHIQKAQVIVGTPPSEKERGEGE